MIMYRPQPLYRILSSSLLVLSLGSCGGGSGDSLAGIDGSGDRVPSLVTGPVNGFGSVIVNGIRFDTRNAQILVQSSEADEALLQVGDMVTIAGYIDEDGEAWAEQVFFRGGLAGAIESVDAEAQQIVLLGQTVQLTEDTILGEEIFPNAIFGLTPGVEVNVSGYSGPQGLFIATRIELAEEALDVLSGPVTDFDAATSTLTVRGVQVVFPELALIDDLRRGQWVSLTGQFLPSGLFEATQLERDTVLRKNKGKGTVEMYGTVEADQEGNLYLGDVALVGDAEVEQTLRAQANSDQALRVRGVYDGDKLSVTDVSAQVRGDTTIAGSVEAIETEGNVGSVTVGGTLFEITKATRLAGPGGRRLDLSSLNLGAQVLISGYQSDDGWMATSIQTGTGSWQNEALKLQGKVQSVAPESSSFSLSGTQITIDAETELLRANQNLSQEEFFELLPGQKVTVHGVLEDNVVRALQVRLARGSSTSTPEASEEE